MTGHAGPHVMSNVAMLGKAVKRTFERRRTSLPEGVPVGLSEDFATASGKNAQWRAFLAKNKLEAPALVVVVRRIQAAAKEVFNLASR